MADYVDDYLNELVRELLWTRNYHQAFVKEIETKLVELSKRYSIDITLE